MPRVLFYLRVSPIDRVTRLEHTPHHATIYMHQHTHERTGLVLADVRGKLVLVQLDQPQEPPRP